MTLDAFPHPTAGRVVATPTGHRWECACGEGEDISAATALLVPSDQMAASGLGDHTRRAHLRLNGYAVP